MSEPYVHQSYPKCIYVQDADGNVCAQTVQSPEALKGLSYAESPAGPFAKAKASKPKSIARARERSAAPRKPKRSRS
jgi:hypothetical protein